MMEKRFYICPEDKTNKGDQAGPKHQIFLFDHRPAESQDGERNRTHDNGNAVQLIKSGSIGNPRKIAAMRHISKMHTA